MIEDKIRDGKGEIEFLPVKKEVILQKNKRNVLFLFQFAQTATEIKETIYELNFDNILDNYTEFTGIYRLRYEAVINRQIEVISDVEKVLVPSNEKNNSNIYVMSIINLDRDGLFCEICCWDLNPNRYTEEEYSKIFFKKLFKAVCVHCGEESMIRFKCPDPECSANYCAKCTNKLIIHRSHYHHSIIKCFKKHEVKYHYNAFMVSEDTFTVCDNCDEYTENYYEDKECNINLCYTCTNALLK